jgi:serine/threonine protein kinase/WD40 repeat protein
MTNRISSYSALSAADPSFDVIVDELIARQNAGEVLDWSAIALEHPEHASRLRSMAVALEALDDVFGTGDAASFGPSRRSGKDDLVRGALGDFHIVREVGRGGMGVVYEAEQVSLNRRVALKVLPLAATMDPRQLQRFRHEARAAGLLHHAHIVPVYGVGCERGIHYYAMQLIEGCSLASVIGEWRDRADAQKQLGSESAPPSAVKQEKTQTRPNVASGNVAIDQAGKSFRRIAELVAQAADALEYAHAMGVVHRDIKPANLLLDARGHVWVTDFGLARLGEGPGLTASGDLLGTLRYMSPEQALAGHGLVDHRTDVYSLGATLYELLTLHPAVDGSSKEEVIRHLAFEDPVVPRKLDRSIPLELETVTLKALAKEPRERYATAQALADDLRRWLADRPIMARQPGRVQRIRRWSQRHRPLVIGIAAFLILAVAALGVALVGYSVKKGELANERSRFAEEKARSERKISQQLRQVLIDRAETIRLARQPGYRKRVWADLRQAIALPPGEAKLDQIRATLVACLGDALGLEQVPDLKAVRRRTIPEMSPAFTELAGKVHNGGTYAVSPPGDMIATVGPDNLISVYDSETHLVWQKPSPLGVVYGLALAEDGKVLVAGCEQGFVAWNLAEPDQWAARVGNVFSVAISPSSDKLAIAGRQFELWSLKTKRPIASWPGPKPGAGIEFSVDGRVRLESGARVEFSADGRVLLAVAKRSPVAGWPVSDTPERRVLVGHTGGVPAVAFSPAGRQLVSVSKDRVVRVWDASTGDSVRTLNVHSGEIESVAFNADGSLLATGDLTGAVRVWNSATGELLGETGPSGVTGQVWRLQFSPGGEYLAAAGMQVVAWTVRRTSGRVELSRLCTVATEPDTLGAVDLVIRPGGRELIFLDRRGRMYSYDLASANNPRLIGNARVALRSLHFAPGGDRLAFLTTGGTLGLWDRAITTSELPEEETPQEAANVKVAIDGATDTHRPGGDIAVSADGRWAAVSSAERGIKIVDLVSGREVFTLPQEAGEIWSLAWAPNGTKLAVGTADGGLALWDLEQVRARLAELGLESPSMASAKKITAPLPIEDFDRVIQLNLLREEVEGARQRALDARLAGDAKAECAHLTAALGGAERLVQAAPEAAGHRERIAWIRVVMARALNRLGDITGALAQLDLEADVLKRLALDDPGNADYRRMRGQALTARAEFLDRAGRRSEALDAARQAVAVRAELAVDPGIPNDRVQLAVVYNNLGFNLSRNGHATEAERWYARSLDVRDEVAENDPATAESTGFRHSKGGTLYNLGVLRAQTGDNTGAAKSLREATAIRNRLADEFPTNAEYSSDAGRTLDWLGGALRNLGQLEEALRRQREAAERQEAALGMWPKSPVVRRLCGNHHAQISFTLLMLGRLAEAANSARVSRRYAGDNPDGLYRAARLLAGCAGRVKRKPAPWAVGLIQARAYGSEAIGLARLAVQNGLADAKTLLAAPDFNPVRDRDEFRALVAELERPEE